MMDQLIQIDNTQTAHFRGRKLRGRRVALPDGYRGVVATHTDRVLPAAQRADGAEDEEAEPEEPVKIMEAQGTFDEFVVWGHEALPAADDAFVKGVEEWLQFADAMHTTPRSATNGNKESAAA
ncbi:Ribonuclease H2, subunit C [Penicillium griseofulvum]|uniref:Ribonuclease H2, subunit C n=1 Tax=Penicillium patulum TaxID=5078 RepID=A0A135LPZ5_PENPA|nr:Ribonuclease H2, subunit C [Penicillium griseofulvum]KXG51033.1 Ribonuclease H2, subunit C [Penicillium griseofulvum]